MRGLRDPLYDIAKALMMIWVIYGHLCLYGIVDTPVLQYMANAKIAVNMPVFFVISGYFAAHTFSIAPWSKLFARSICLVWPQIFWATFCAMGVLLATAQGFGNVFGGVMHGWFLKCIAVVYLMSAVVCKRLKNNWSRLICFAVLYSGLLSWPISLRVECVDQIIHMLPYFVFGIIVLPALPLHKNRIAVGLCGVVYLAVVFLEGDSNLNGMNFWKVSVSWHSLMNREELFVSLARVFVGIVGTIFILGVIDVALFALPVLRRFSGLGTNTLGIYVIHEWILGYVGFRFPLFPLHVSAIVHWMLAIGIFLICHFVVELMQMNKWSAMIFRGDEARLSLFFSNLWHKMQQGKH